MTKVVAGITTSLDGYITGPNDGPGRGLGDNGEQLHYWVFGGPWTYDQEPTGEPTGADKEFLDSVTANIGAVIGGRNTYEAAEAWGGQNPWGIPFFILTHHPEDAPADAGFTFVTVQGSEAVNVLIYGGQYLASYPMHIYGSALRFLFVWLVPIGLAIYVPTHGVLGRERPPGLPAWLAWLAAPVAAAFLAAGGLAWRAGIRHYVGTGS